MQEAVPVGRGSMIAVLGMETANLEKLIKKNNEIKDICEIANDNSFGQLIVSGIKESVESLQKILKNQKIKTIPLKVSAPFHCSLMKSAADKMKEKIDEIKFVKPNIEIINNVMAEIENDPKKIKNLLVEQIFSTVRWRESLILMSQKGVKNFIEIGPGKVLTGMVKRTIKNVNCFSINSITDIKNLINELKK